MVAESNREISFVIERRLGVLSEAGNGWRKELNLVSWNGKNAKLDIREWSPDHTRMAKGITLRSEEARILQRSLYRWFTGYGKPAEEAAAQMVVIPDTGEIMEPDMFPDGESPADETADGGMPVEELTEMLVEKLAEDFIEEEAENCAADEIMETT